MPLPSQLAASALIAASLPIRSTRLPLMRVLIKVPANSSARFKTLVAKPGAPPVCAVFKALSLAWVQARFLAAMSEFPARTPPSATS